MNQTARTYPRTLQEAFGDHTSRRISEPVDHHALADTVIAVLSIIALIVIGLTA